MSRWIFVQRGVLSGGGFVRGACVQLPSKGSTKRLYQAPHIVNPALSNTYITKKRWYVRWMSLFSSHISVMAETIKESFSKMSEHFCCGLLRYLVLMAASACREANLAKASFRERHYKLDSPI